MAVLHLIANNQVEGLLWNNRTAVELGIRVTVERNGSGLVLKGNVSFSAMRKV